MVFPLAGLVSEAFREPVIRETMDPSAALSALTNSLPASSVPWISYPQTMGSTVAVGGSGMTCHPPPRPSASAGLAVAMSAPRPASGAPPAVVDRLMGYPLQGCACDQKYSLPPVIAVR